MDSAANIVVLAGLLIGLVYGAVGLLSGFCMTSSLRGWWAEGDGRLVRTYALAMGVAVAATQLLAAAGLVLLGRGNLRSFVVVIVLGIVAMMTLKGLIAPARIALLQASQTTTKVTSVPALLSALGL